MIELKNIYKDYGSGEQVLHALDGISLNFADSGFVSVLGPSGCGKTTILNILGGLDRPTSGEMIVDGRSTDFFSSKDFDFYRNQMIGFVFQDYDLLSELTALENVRLSLDIRRIGKKKADHLAREALARVGLKGREKSKPRELSGGQKQRVAIARALVGNPSILLADEPTGALDTKSGREVIEILKEISSSILVVMVTHNQELARKYSDRIITLQDGRVVSDTNPYAPCKPRDYPNAKKVGLGIFGAIVNGLRHTVNKIGRSLSVALTTTFGIASLGFSLALSNGFGAYVDKVDQTTASNAPIVIQSYTLSSSSSEFDQYNQTVKYPDDNSVFPIYTPAGSYTYKYNNLSDKFIDYVDELKKEGLLTDYVLKRSTDNSLKVLTSYPASINPESPGEDDSGIKSVSVSMTSTMASGTGGGTYVANTIFHSLLDGYEEKYDLLAGTLPTSADELVMIVDYRNAISFSTLRELGFYNPSDTQDDVYDATLESKVEPISFETILGKEYKIYDLDRTYLRASDYAGEVSNTAFASFETVKDSDGNTRTIERYYPADNDDLWNDSPSMEKKDGITAKIVGIIRPKESTNRANMSSGIGYLPDTADKGEKGLLETIREFNEKSSIMTDFKNAFVRRDSWVYNSATGEYEEQSDTSTLELFNKLSSQFVDEDGNLKDSISTTELQSIYQQYFTGYMTFSSNFNPSRNYKKENYSDGYLYGFKAYTTLSNYFSAASSLGLDFSNDDLKGLTLDDTETLQKFFTDGMQEYLKGDFDALYDRLLALGQLVYTKNDITSIILLPSSLSAAKKIEARLDEFNDYKKYDGSLEGGDASHAKDTTEVVAYSNYGYDITEDIGQAVEMTNVILGVFSIVTLIGSVVVTMTVTNMSVMERRKEIGILRALGSSKSDIGWVFESESFIVGLAGGLLGTLLTYIISFPINALTDAYYPSYNMGNIAVMAWWHPLVLIPLATVITMLASFIPSLHAARKKPVECLKSDQ